MGIHLFGPASFMPEPLSFLCFILILLLPFFPSMLPHLNFCFVFLSVLQQTLNRFSSVFYLTIPSSTSSPAACRSASTNYPSFQLLIQFASPNPFPESLGQQDIYSPFFHRCLAQSLCMFPPQAICFFFLPHPFIISYPTYSVQVFAFIMSGFGFCPSLFHSATLFTVTLPITFNDSQICHYLPNYSFSQTLVPLHWLCVSVHPHISSGAPIIFCI